MRTGIPLERTGAQMSTPKSTKIWHKSRQIHKTEDLRYNTKLGFRQIHIFLAPVVDGFRLLENIISQKTVTYHLARVSPEKEVYIGLQRIWCPFLVARVRKGAIYCAGVKRKRLLSRDGNGNYRPAIPVSRFAFALSVGNQKWCNWM